MNDRETVDRIAAQFEAFKARTSPRAIKAHRRRVAGFFRRLKIAIFAVLGVIFAGGIVGAFVTPLGIGGFALMLVAMAMAFFAVMAWPGEAEPTPQQMARSELPALPSQTERWLEAQRPALPAPAQRLADEIGIKLEAIGPQLATLDPREPAADQLRKLMAQELPELIDGYRRVPENMRREARNGSSPDTQLLDGLRVVDEELARVGSALVAGDLDKLATQGRYLELKYRGDETLRNEK